MKNLPPISKYFSANSAIYAFKHSKIPEGHNLKSQPKLYHDQALIYDHSWNPDSDQPRLVLAWKKGKRKYVSVKMDINQNNEYSVCSQESLGIPRQIIKKSKIQTVRLQRGLGNNNAVALQVIGETILDLRHAKGRTRRQNSKLEEEDLKSLMIKTLVVVKLPSFCQYDIIAGEDFLDENKIHIDRNHGQLLDLKSKTFIQYHDPTKEWYQDIHSRYWRKHASTPKLKPFKPKQPKSCDQCQAKIIETTASPKFSKNDRITFHFTIRDMKLKMSGKVSRYANSHLINIIVPGKKLTISVPECNVTAENSTDPPILNWKNKESPTTKCGCLQNGLPDHSFICILQEAAGAA